MVQVGDIIKTLFKKYEVKSQLSEDSYICECKNRKFLLRVFEPRSEKGQELEYSLTRIKSSGISAPKLMLFDHKKGYAIVEYIEGESVAKILSEKDLTDDIYKQLFDNAYLAKIVKATLNYEPDHWLLSNGKIFYVHPHIIEYAEEKDLVKHYIKLWFNTKELAKYLADLGLSYDKSRIQNEYATNKEILLKTVSFYR